MVSELELKVRAMDDESRGAWPLAKEIAERENLKFGTVWRYLHAKRHGFKSHTDQINNYAQRKGYKGHSKYQEHRAIERGFLSCKEISHVLRLMKEKRFDSVKEAREYLINRRGLLKKLDYLNPSILDCFPAGKDFSLERIYGVEERRKEIAILINKIVETLNERDQKIIKGRFFEDKTLQKLGDERRVTAQTINILEERALKKLYYRAKKIGLYDLYIDGAD